MMHEQIGKTWQEEAEAVLDRLGVSRDAGLSAGDIRGRQQKYGRNVFRRQKSRSVLSILTDQFKSFVIALLLAAAVVSLLLGHHVEAIAVLAAILINTVIGFVTELKAVRSMDALRKLSQVEARVRRDSDIADVSAINLVVGDIVPLEAGDLIPADLRLLEANKLQVNESALTGESEPVTKDTEPKAADAPLAERTCMVYKGTSITRGSGEGVVVAVGRQTEIGQIQTMLEEAEEETTPLEKRLNRLAHRLIWVTLGLTAVLAVVGTLSGRDLTLMIKSAVALAVAAIPEGLPIVATVALARGMLDMARRNALVNKLASVETLGATSIIGADKTGTLTENRMTVRSLILGAGARRLQWKQDHDKETAKSDGSEATNADDRLLKEALRTGVLCNNASLSNDDEEDGGSGDPMEIALLAAGQAADITRKGLLDEWPEVREEAFDPDTKMMATIHETDAGYLVAVKGAPNAVIEKCSRIAGEDGDRDFTDDDRENWSKHNEDLANDGFRVLAVANKKSESRDVEPYEALTLIGLVGLLDPAREDVPEAIAECRNAGVRVIMMTGDQPGTARKIAADIGLVDDPSAEVVLGTDLGDDDEEISNAKRGRILETSIFARVTPRQKLTIIDKHREAGSVVAMTGDGVNDAPALKKADIGVAMGKRGTQVAREAADMILRDDAFPTIVIAIRQGRVIFENIRKFVVYLLSGNVAEIIAVAAASVAHIPLPLLPLQILFLNLVLDVFPALALGLGRGDPHIMQQPPRPSHEPVLPSSHWQAITVYGVVIAAAVLAALLLAIEHLQMEPEQAVTVSFLTLSFARMWHVFNMRDRNAAVFKNEITRNPFVWLALSVCLVLIVAATQIPVLAQVLSLRSPSVSGWLLAWGASLTPVIIGQLLKSMGVVKA